MNLSLDSTQTPQNFDPPKPSLGELSSYFLHLGTTGFGGPAALVGRMRTDLVDDKKWISSLVFGQGLALAQMAPGPVATQLAIYIGLVS